LEDWASVPDGGNDGILFLFAITSKPALGSTQPPIHWVPGTLSLWVKRPVREADHSPLSSAKVKEGMELYIHSPNMSSWCGASLSTGTSLTFTFAFRHVIFLL
jgi:hypothetical protein